MGRWGYCKVTNPYTESSSATNPMRERDDINTTLATVSDGLGKDIRGATFKGNFIEDFFQIQFDSMKRKMKPALFSVTGLQDGRFDYEYADGMLGLAPWHPRSKFDEKITEQKTFLNFLSKDKFVKRAMTSLFIDFE